MIDLNIDIDNFKCPKCGSTKCYHSFPKGHSVACAECDWKSEIYINPHVQQIELPKCNEWGTPISKMPNCPNCNEDELGMIHPNYTICYACGTEFHRFSFSRCGENLFIYKVNSNR